VKVTDRRRFTSEGEAVESGAEGVPAAVGEGAAPGASAGGSQDPRDAQLAAGAARIDELTRAYAALLEDNKAFRRRLEREKERVVEAERASVAQALLEAADDLERALAAVRGAGDAGAGWQPLAEGVRLSLGRIQRRVADLGAERLEVQGKPFDPRLAEAVDTVAVADASRDGLVVQEVRAGYRIGDRILRPARVRVGRLARA
jgi:molecular chaperone GrpE